MNDDKPMALCNECAELFKEHYELKMGWPLTDSCQYCGRKGKDYEVKSYVLRGKKAKA